MLLDVFEYLAYLDQQRYRGIILHAPPDKGPSVTQFARKVCAQAGGTYLDLLGLFIQDQNLSQQIDRFGPEKLRALLMERSRAASLLFVDRADFLLDTWRRDERQAFFRIIRVHWDGYRETMRAKLWFALQSSSEIEALSIVDSNGNPRVLRLSDFTDIP